MLPLLPDPVLAHASSGDMKARQAIHVFLNRVGGLVTSGQVGSPERLTIARVYNPERTNLSSLVTLANRDIELAGRVLSRDLSIEAAPLIDNTLPGSFGSYSARFDREGFQVIWQALARIGRSERVSEGTMLLMGSKGVLQLNMDQLSYRLVDLRGRVVQSGKSEGIAAVNRSTVAQDRPGLF